MADGGHTFVKKNFHKPTYCHHCSDLLWFGLIGQGYICEVCNFIIHERCVTNVVTPCSGIAPCIIKNPIAHCWSEPTHHRKKFCTVCRKRLDETPAVHCLVCEYFAHIECQDFAVPDCTENATYVPGKELLNVKHQHHWREGNLPPTSKCIYCKKTCWSSECLTGYRCEWCGLTTHGGCRMYLPTECNFGILQPIYLPPHAVSIPRTEVPIEAIIGVQVKSKSGLVRDYSCPAFSKDVMAEAKTTESHTVGLSLKETLWIDRQRRKRMKQMFLSSLLPSTSLPVFSSISRNDELTDDTNTLQKRGCYGKYDSFIDIRPQYKYRGRKIKRRRLSESDCNDADAEEEDDLGIYDVSLVHTSDESECSYIKLHQQQQHKLASTSGMISDDSVAESSSSKRIMDDDSNCSKLTFCGTNSILNRHQEKNSSDLISSNRNTSTCSLKNAFKLQEQRLAHDSNTAAAKKINLQNTSVSVGNSSECCYTSVKQSKSELTKVERSKSFQEPGVKLPRQQSLLARYKKYAHSFKRRHLKWFKSKSENELHVQNEGPLTIMLPNVVITIQDEDGIYQSYDDNYDILTYMRPPTRTTNNEALDDENDSPSSNTDMQCHNLRPDYSDGTSGDVSDKDSSRCRSSENEDLFNRLLNKMRRLSVGLRKTRYHRRRARSISEEFSSGDTPRVKEDELSIGKGETMVAAVGSSSVGSSSPYRPESSSGAHKSDKSEKDKEKKEKEREEKDIEAIKVFDGNSSFRRQLYRVIIVPRTYTLEQLLTTALRAFHITRDPSAFYLTDLYAPVGSEDTPLQDPNPVQALIHIEGKRPAIYLRFHDRDMGHVRVYPGKLQCSLEDPYVNVPVDNTTLIMDLIRDALNKFGLQDDHIEDYRCSEVLLDRGVTERILSRNERPWEITKQLGKDSIRQMELMRFYMQHKQDPHGPNIALFVGNLPPGLSQRNYEQILNRYVTDENKFTSIGPIYYEYGSVVLTFEDAQKAVRAFYNLRETIIEDKKLLVLLLPNIEPSMVPSDVRPLLVFVNVKSGGCQGLELISSFRKLLNPFQVFDLDNGGPLPGLYVFRQIANYKILVCGGDGTIGWVLQCLDNVGQDSECSSPPCAIVPLGTGNDLARVLCWGSGYTGGEDPLNLLRDVIDAEEIRLDRWTVVFHPEERPEEPAIKPPSNTTGGGAQNEDNSQIFVMNNYFGIGVDADLCLDFHNAREENPNKFNSRLHNKGYYVKMGLRKIVGRKTVKELHKELRLEVDGKVVELPPVEGIIILNILSWGSGANPWGPDKDDNFSTPNHYDGVLEIVGVSGVVHLGQIQSGIRTATRIAQGGHIKIHLFSDMPVQVDGEPWVQSPGDVVVLKSALKATMLKKSKSKMKRRNTEPLMVMAGTAGTQMALTLPPSTTTEADNESENSPNNTDF